MAFKLSDDRKKIVISGELPTMWEFYGISIEAHRNEKLRRFKRKIDQLEVDALLFVNGITFEGVPNAPASTGRGYLVFTSEGDLLAVPFREFTSDYDLLK